MCTNCFTNWRYWISPLVIVVYLIFVIFGVPILIVNSVKDGFTKKEQLMLIGGLFVLSAVPISMYQIIQHVIHFTKPALQKHIIRILWMVPIYALNAWLCLLFPRHSIYMDSIRECYEAYVIYNFMKYLLNYLNLEMDLERSLEFKPPVKHFFPLCFLSPWTMGRDFVHNCKHGILQYTVVRPLSTFVSFVCEMNGVYGEGSFSTNVAFPYIILVNNLSQFLAMYCLVLFYKANRDELKPMKPIPKFLCIKAVIFFSFFQGVVINILTYFGFIKDIFGSEEGEGYQLLSSKLQNFLICIEMFLAALAHHYSFPHKDFHMVIPLYSNPNAGSWYNRLVTMLDISDVQQDVSEHIGVVSSSLSRRLRGRTTYQTPRGNSGCDSVSGSEREFLVQPSGSKTNLGSSEHYQSGLSITGTNSIAPNKANKYGAVDAGIDIVKKKDENRQYRPIEGSPKLPNIFKFNDPANKSDLIIADSPSFDNLLNLSSKSEPSISKKDENSSIRSRLPNSDSNNSSDWLNSTDDLLLGIDVKGFSNDNINYNPDRNA